MDENTIRAADAISEALDDGYDIAEFTANALCTAAAEAGGIEELLANRSGSWEADLVRRLMEGTAGDDLARFRKQEPEPGRCDAELRYVRGTWRLEVRVPEMLVQGGWPTTHLGTDQAAVPTVEQRTEALGPLGYRPADPERVGWTWSEVQESPDLPPVLVAYTTVRPL